jgi:hypothetical protein
LREPFTSPLLGSIVKGLPVAATILMLQGSKPLFFAEYTLLKPIAFEAEEFSRSVAWPTNRQNDPEHKEVCK